MSKILFSSPRIHFREWNIDDAMFLFDLNSQSVVLEYTGDSPFPDLNSAKDFINNYENHRRDGFGRWMMILKKTQKPIGWCGLKKHPDFIDLGFRLHPEHWGKGYATEAAERCAKFGFESLGMHEIWGRVAFDNQASINVLEKIGMKYSHDDYCDHHPANIYKLKKEY